MREKEEEDDDDGGVVVFVVDFFLWLASVFVFLVVVCERACVCACIVLRFKERTP